ncbi:hypothetical protein BS47DRAFT_1397852 [Hydnum rufescens UP504]|uniref:Choline/carnitine acyltransferase domain-containing protein n=1 Tax=Hydnum rufescens UP504 TaxID=1448309 RepID=A0A9P6AME2_9AGAM|nr:hypothetical protein BS47DRAFT_1397852 [Hydnum rufescens UP504]
MEQDAQLAKLIMRDLKPARLILLQPHSGLFAWPSRMRHANTSVILWMSRSYCSITERNRCESGGCLLGIHCLFNRVMSAIRLLDDLQGVREGLSDESPDTAMYDRLARHYTDWDATGHRLECIHGGIKIKIGSLTAYMPVHAVVFSSLVTKSSYEPEMTKAFLHGHTETMRTVRPESVQFTKVRRSSPTASPTYKIKGLRTACDAHVKPTRECGKGLAQDQSRDHERAMRGSANQSNNGTGPPTLFTDPGWHLLNTSILSTSNCGNPALRLFGFGPSHRMDLGLDTSSRDAISICASSKHLQTRRFLDTIAQYLQDVQPLDDAHLSAG